MTRLLSYDEFQIGQKLIADGICDNEFRAAHIVINLKLADLRTTDERLARARLYRDFRNAGETSKVAYMKAIAGEAAPVPILKEAAHSEVE